MPGICIDEDKCKDGCGNLDRKDLGITTCTSKDASICATAYLTLDNGLGPFQYINCLWLTTTIHYTASQADAASNPAVTTTSSSISLSSSASTLSTPSQTIGNPSSTESKGGSTAGNNNNNNNNNNNSGGGDGSNSNIGAIVGGVIGGLAIICAFVFAAYLVWIYRIRDRRKQQQAGAHVSEPLNGNGNGDGDGSGRSSEDDDTTRSNLPPPLSYSPDGGQPYGGPGHHGQGYDDVPFVEMEQRTLKDAEGGWGPRELDSGFERGGGFAHEQQQGLQPGQSGPVYEVLSVEEVAEVAEVAEMPVRIEPVELSS
ncbi:hypothetical protein N0V85_001530 [Neurospora sp. IMI 360204]|nr:hypothetical protein N0V85_001530 [Neurospora sp. IMI 360204]